MTKMVYTTEKGADEAMRDSRKRQMLQTMITGALLIFFTGFVHVWSIFTPYVMKETGWAEGTVSLAFYLANCSFVLGNILGGRLNGKLGAKKVVALGGGLFAGGIALSGLAIRLAPAALYLTYGLVMGVGSGMAYAVILDTAQKWFPERTGFASGVVVTSNGLCGFFMAPMSRMLLARFGVGTSFLVTAALTAAAWLLSAFFLRTPENTGTGKAAAALKGRQYTAPEMLKTGMYYELTLAMFFGLMPYYLISPVSQTFQMEHGVLESVAVASVMIGALLNASLRLLLPTLADRLGRFRCVRALLAVSFASMLLLASGNGTMVVIGVVLAYGCFGGVMGNFPSLTSMVFGLKHAGENYGYVMIGMILSALGAPLIRSWLSALGLTGAGMYFAGAVFAAAAILLLILLERENHQTERKGATA